MTDPAATEGRATGITMEELALAARNHGMPLEALRYDVTPVGLHYLLIHFDIPAADETTWRLEVGGRVERPLPSRRCPRSWMPVRSPERARADRPRSRSRRPTIRRRSR